jgi:hypothetical protein
LPEDLTTIWTKIDTKEKGTRISAGFTRDNPLVIEQDNEFDGFYKNSPVTTYINNIEYPRGKERVEIPDMYYLITALEANLPKEQKSKLVTNADYVRALQKQAGKLFKARLHWETYCNPNKNIYAAVEDAEGNTTVKEQEGTPGCEKKYVSYDSNKYTKIPTDENGAFKDRFDEAEVDPNGCPASLIANAKLSQFAAVTKPLAE